MSCAPGDAMPMGQCVPSSGAGNGIDGESRNACGRVRRRIDRRDPPGKLVGDDLRRAQRTRYAQSLVTTGDPDAVEGRPRTDQRKAVRRCGPEPGPDSLQIHPGKRGNEVKRAVDHLADDLTVERGVPSGELAGGAHQQLAARPWLHVERERQSFNEYDVSDS